MLLPDPTGASASTPSLSSLLSAVASYTLIGPDQLTALYALSHYVAEKAIAGDLVECGVANGGSAAVIAAPHGAHPRRLWLYDTWAGIPAAGPEDGARAQSHTGAWKGTRERTREALAFVAVPAHRVMWRPGLFADTMAAEQPLPERVALLHIDADWRDSVLLALRTFYPRVSDGGVVILDDFGYWEGCRTAFYEWCAESGEMPLVERAGRFGLWWKKGAVSNAYGLNE